MVITSFMKLSFKLGDAFLDTAEANALFSATETKASITINILDHINLRDVDAKKLFSLSVEKKNPTLASLAAKCAIEGLTPGKKRRTAPMNRIVDIAPSKSFSDPDEAVAAINQIDHIKGLGAAMLLVSLRDGHKKTLRQVAVEAVNYLAYRGEVSADSDCFRGFIKSENGSYRPISKAPGVGRNEVYHASPMYIALRDGLALLASWGMVRMEKTVEFGSKDSEPNGNSDLLRRTVYAVELTPAGLTVANQWGDISYFVTTRWSQRVRTRSVYSV